MKHNRYVIFTITLFLITLSNSCYQDYTQNKPLSPQDQESLNAALIQCLKEPQIAFLEMVLKRGADPNSSDKITGLPAIMLAVHNNTPNDENDYVEIPELLLKYKADIRVTDKEGGTLSDHLIKNNASPRLKALLNETTEPSYLALTATHYSFDSISKVEDFNKTVHGTSIPKIQRFSSAPIEKTCHLPSSPRRSSLGSKTPILEELKKSSK